MKKFTRYGIDVKSDRKVLLRESFKTEENAREFFNGTVQDFESGKKKFTDKVTISLNKFEYTNLDKREVTK